MMSLLCSLLCFCHLRTASYEHFKNFEKRGYEPYCFVDYKNKIVNCSYKTMHDCREHYSVNSVGVCFARKNLKLGDEQ